MVFVTGAGGFIGSHLAERLVELGYKVRCFIRYNSRNQWGWLDASKYKDKIDFYLGDIRDFNSVFNGLKGCNGVFHLAALIGIPYSYLAPLSYIKTNIEGTYNILQSALQLRLKNTIITSTSEVYGTAQYTPIDERHPINPQSIYAGSKASADSIAYAYYLSYGMPVKIVRPFNTYGPRQSARAVIPTIITQALLKKRIKIGAIFPTRDFTYIDDIVDGFIRVFERNMCIGEVINLGSGREISIKDLIKMVAQLTGGDFRIGQEKKRIRPEMSEVRQLVADISKAKRLINWKPKIPLEEGLRLTAEWIKEHLHLYKAELYNL